MDETGKNGWNFFVRRRCCCQRFLHVFFARFAYRPWSPRRWKMKQNARRNLSVSLDDMPWCSACATSFVSELRQSFPPRSGVGNINGKTFQSATFEYMSGLSLQTAELTATTKSNTYQLGSIRFLCFLSLFCSIRLLFNWPCHTTSCHDGDGDERTMRKVSFVRIEPERRREV